MLDAGYCRGGDRYTPQNLHWFNHAGVIVSSYTCRNGSGRRDIPSPRGIGHPPWCTARSGRRRLHIRYSSNSVRRPWCTAPTGRSRHRIRGSRSTARRPSCRCRNGRRHPRIPGCCSNARRHWCTHRCDRCRRHIRDLSNSALRPSCIARNGTHHRHIPGWNSSGHRWPVGFRTVRVPRMSRRASRLVDPVMRRRLTHPTAEGPAARRRRARRGSCPTGWMHGSRIVMDGQTRQHLLKC